MSIKEEREMELLSAYLDDELEGSDKERVSSFLANSPDARKALSELHHTKTLFVATPRISAPTDFLDMLEMKAEQAMEMRAAKTSFWDWANPWAWTSLTATVSAAAFAIVIGFHSPRQIPYQVLLAAHASAQGSGGLHQTVMSAAHSSTYNADTNAKA